MKKNYIKKAFELGFLYEKKYHGCAQCTIAAIQDSLDIRNDHIFKAASTLGGGIGKLTDGACGGYSGGAIMISTFFGRTKNKFDDDEENKFYSNQLTIKLHQKFINVYRSVICQEIHESIFGRTFNLWDEEKKREFERLGAHQNKCTNVVANAAAWTTELILNELERENRTLKDFRYINI